MTTLRRKLFSALAESFGSYQTHGARSSRKLHALHRFLADETENLWGAGYETHYLGEGRREFQVAGKYYDKNVDIVTAKDGVAVFGLGVKFVTSNYAQNSNNYFESMMGETANIQRMDVPYAQAIFLRDPMPYLKRGGEIARWERIDADVLRKYVSYFFDPFYPTAWTSCIELINFDEEGKVRGMPLDSAIHGNAFVELYQRRFSLEAMFERIHTFKIFYEDGGDNSAGARILWNDTKS